MSGLVAQQPSGAVGLGEPAAALDPQLAAYLKGLAADGAPRVTALTPSEARQRLAARRAAGPAAQPPVRLVEEVAFLGPGGELRGRRYRPPQETGLVVVYFHGGGWVTGDLETADGTARRLAVGLGADLLSVGYRLAPENPFPAALRDAEAAVRWAGRSLVGGRPLVVAGDSAGGNLAAVCAADRDALEVPIAAQLLNYPVTDCDLERPSYRRERDALLSLRREEMDWYWDHYLPDPARRRDPAASPLRTPDLSRAAPAVLVLARHDPLFDEGQAYAARLRAAGVAVAAFEFDAAVHGFLGFPGSFAIRDRALELAAGALHDFVSGGDPPPSRSGGTQ